jgi:anti-sigma-K factor RskA
MTAPGPEHAKWAEDVGAYLLGALEADERKGFEAHLESCPVCRRDVDDLKVAADALPVSVPLVKPPEALKHRIMTVVRSEAELLAAAGARADAPEGAPSRATASRERRRWSLGGWLGRPAVALACAAVLLVAGGLAGALLSGGEETRTVVAQTSAAGADVRLEIGEDGSQLVAQNMPAPPEGRIYQVWLKRPGQDPEPTSVLWSTRTDGSAEVAVPGSLDGVEAVLVTDEPFGGSEEPSKDPVITAVPA